MRKVGCEVLYGRSVPEVAVNTENSFETLLDIFKEQQKIKGAIVANGESELESHR